MNPRFGQAYDDEFNVACPLCGFDYSHIREVFTRPGSDPYEGAMPTRAPSPKGGRRSGAMVS